MLVEVIVPAFNRHEWLRECLVSILQQTYQNFQILLVDDGSEIPVKDHPLLADIVNDLRVTLIRKAHGGLASARNSALDMARGDYILPLDSDDKLEPFAIDKMLKALLRSNAKFAAGHWTDFSSTLGDRVCYRPIPVYKDSYANCVAVGCVSGSFMMKGPIEVRYQQSMPWENVEFLLDYLAPGQPAVYVDTSIVNIRQHSRPDRLTLAYDHFEPFKMGAFFARKKKQLVHDGQINTERASALDGLILRCIHSLLRTHRTSDASVLFKEISWDLIDQYHYMRFGSFAWSSKHFGFLGAKLFIAGNRLIGRA